MTKAERQMKKLRRKLVPMSKSELDALASGKDTRSLLDPRIDGLREETDDEFRERIKRALFLRSSQ